MGKYCLPGSVLWDITYSQVHLACVELCADITNCSERNCFRTLRALVADQQVLAEIESGEYSLNELAARPGCCFL
jgi:hypothetical protein